MDSLAAEVRGLVEAAFLVGWPRLRQGGDDLEDRALRRRRLEWKLQAGPLVELELPNR